MQAAELMFFESAILIHLHLPQFCNFIGSLVNFNQMKVCVRMYGAGAAVWKVKANLKKSASTLRSHFKSVPSTTNESPRSTYECPHVGGHIKQKSTFHRSHHSLFINAWRFTHEYFLSYCTLWRLLFLPWKVIFWVGKKIKHKWSQGFLKTALWSSDP